MNIDKKIKIGEVIKVHYLIFLKNKKKKKKTCFFIGLCINKKKGFFQLTNKVSKEQILISFGKNSPVIFKILILKIYKKLNFRVSKLFFKKNKVYLDDVNSPSNIIDSSIRNIQKKYYFSAYFKIKQIKKKRKIKKLKRKYFRTLNWLNIKKKVKKSKFVLEKILNENRRDENEQDENEQDENEQDENEYYDDTEEQNQIDQ